MITLWNDIRDLERLVLYFLPGATDLIRYVFFDSRFITGPDRPHSGVMLHSESTNSGAD